MSSDLSMVTRWLDAQRGTGLAEGTMARTWAYSRASSPGRSRAADDCAAYLGPWMEKRRAETDDSESHLFPSVQDPSRCFNTSTLNAAWRRLRARLGIRLTWYQATRHSVASRLSAAGVPIDEIADALGHSSPVITRQYYDHYIRKSYPGRLRGGLGFGATTSDKPSASRSPERNQLQVIGVLGDIHAEDKRLAAALAHLRGAGVDRILSVGDIADGPGDVSSTCAQLAADDIDAVRGNHERWLLTDTIRDVPDATPSNALGASERQFLESLPVVREYATKAGRLLLCHGLGLHDMASLQPDDDGEHNAALQALIARIDLAAGAVTFFDLLERGDSMPMTACHCDCVTSVRHSMKLLSVIVRTGCSSADCSLPISNVPPAARSSSAAARRHGVGGVASVRVALLQQTAAEDVERAVRRHPGMAEVVRVVLLERGVSGLRHGHVVALAERLVDLQDDDVVAHVAITAPAAVAPPVGHVGAVGTRIVIATRAHLAASGLACAFGLGPERTGLVLGAVRRREHPVIVEPAVSPTCRGPYMCDPSVARYREHAPCQPRSSR